MAPKMVASSLNHLIEYEYIPKENIANTDVPDLFYGDFGPAFCAGRTPTPRFQ